MVPNLPRPSRRPQDGPRCLKMAQDSPRRPQDSPKTAPRHPKTAPRRSKMAPRWMIFKGFCVKQCEKRETVVRSKVLGVSWSKNSAIAPPRRPQDDPRRPKTTQDDPRWPQDCPWAVLHLSWAVLDLSWGQKGCHSGQAESQKHPPQQLLKACVTFHTLTHNNKIGSAE